MTLGDLWMTAMLNGDFAEAWRISDTVLIERKGICCRHLPHHLRWVWDGTPLADRRVLIRCYHGLGDTLQFIRFAPVIARHAAAVYVEAQPELLPLLGSVAGIDAFLPLDGVAPRHDVEIESMEVPHALRTTLATLPSNVPYLAPPSAAVRRAERLVPTGGGLKVGLVWEAGDWRRERSLPPELLHPLTDLPVALVNLQHGPARGRVPPSSFAAAIPPEAPLAETAALIARLDLIVTVDTMAAHLAGALARPVWLLLDTDADWRWLRDRSDSPWYPTMRIFRQAQAGAWRPVVAAVAAEIERYAAVRKGTLPSAASL
jgi:glycosyl transferase family 9 (putative heptosyltransferase)